MELVIIMLVSSAKSTGLDLLIIMFGKAFIYKRNNKGPRIDPWGTPFLTEPHLE
jgi:hypothetical protein